MHIYICVCVCVCVFEDFFYMRDPSNFSTDKSQMILDRAKEEVKKDD